LVKPDQADLGGSVVQNATDWSSTATRRFHVNGGYFPTDGHKGSGLDLANLWKIPTIFVAMGRMKKQIADGMNPQFLIQWS
jgi:hypothetical protein